MDNRSQNAFAGGYVKPFDATFASTLTLDFAKSTIQRCTLTGNVTLANPSNLIDGMIVNVRLKQDATGGRTVTPGSKWKLPSGTAFSTAANKVDWISGIYSSDDDVIDCGVLIGIH